MHYKCYNGRKIPPHILVPHYYHTNSIFSLSCISWKRDKIVELDFHSFSILFPQFIHTFKTLWNTSVFSSDNTLTGLLIWGYVIKTWRLRNHNSDSLRVIDTSFTPKLQLFWKWCRLCSMYSLFVHLMFNFTEQNRTSIQLILQFNDCNSVSFRKYIYPLFCPVKLHIRWTNRVHRVMTLQRNYLHHF